MPPDVFKVCTNARSVSKEGRLFILDVNTGKYYSLNQVGAAIWTGLELGRTRQELISTLLEKFDVSEETLSADIDALVARLLELRWIESVPTPSAPRGAPSSLGAVDEDRQLHSRDRRVSK